MKRFIKLSGLLMGAIALISGLTSCKKDDDGPACCNIDESDTYYGITFDVTGKACEDGTYTVTISYGDESYTYSGNWKENNEDDMTWAEIKETYC